MLLARNSGYLCRIIALVGVLASVVAFTMTTPALATDHSYSCESCAALNGPNDWIDEVGGTDYSYRVLFVYEWKFNGGSNWNVEAEAYTENGTHLKVCTGADEVYGHGESLNGGFNEHMSGREANYKNCSIP
jgi:hypothetical protein